MKFDSSSCRPVVLSILRNIVLGLFASLPLTAWADQGFQPVSPDELSIKSEPLAPGAPAVILYRQVDRDDSNPGTVHEFNYLRIKILNEEGRKHADVELPYWKENEDIRQIHARTVKPDGSIINFDGKIFDKSLVKARQFRIQAKTFTLPEVEAGSIIEYYYTVELKRFENSHWILSEDLFTKNARFSLKPYQPHSRIGSLSLRSSGHNLPAGAEVKQGPDHVVRMEVNNIPSFQTEDYMPPPNEVKSRVDFIYEAEAPDKDASAFWQRNGKAWNDRLEKFVGKREAMEQAVAQIVSPSDPPEVKLRKIYDRVQEIRNKSYEIRKTQQEQKRDNEKVDENVEDVWRRGYGTGQQLTWLYLALVRAAGFEAYGCWVSNRRDYFFSPRTMEPLKLTANVVLVKLNGKDLYFNPGAEFTPFGMLTWSETGVQGLKLDKDGGTWIQTSLPQSSESRIERKAKLKLAGNGDLQGKLAVTYTGLEAMYIRLELRHDDDLARKKALEESVKAQIPAAAEAELTNKPDWNNSETPLIAEFDLKVPGWSASAGKGAMMPAGLFTAREKHMFEHANRVHPIYFAYPFEKLDDVLIELPTGWQVTGVPPAQAKDSRVVTYGLKVENGKEGLHLTRKLTVDVLLLEQKYYTALRDFLQIVRTGDEQQILLQPAAAAAAN